MGRARDASSHDRISELPDPILDHILSLMPAKAATHTTILSQRWSHLWDYIWCSATTPDFAAEFAARQTPDDFVCNRFLVSFPAVNCFFPDVEKRVEFAVAKDVEELWLEFSSQGQETYFCGDFENWVCGFRIPHQLFDCIPLRVLGLNNCGLSPSPGIPGLHSLRSLSLTRVDVTTDMLHIILSKCLHLERLLLRDCVHFNSLKLTCPYIKLKQLVLVGNQDGKHLLPRPAVLVEKERTHIVPRAISRSKKVEELRRYMNGKHIDSENWSLRYLDPCPQQGSRDDCVIFTYKFIECLARRDTQAYFNTSKVRPPLH
ncbi:hypothetical protein Taro_054734 [Colocasia esculenta]|uniref:F-box domain-containing protein n=1 Tax=Colocasia esculenta TaxID=4460 RepID=A0A843XPN5_COLES|nr:hypothetical protein [Colocasia esculenta]